MLPERVWLDLRGMDSLEKAAELVNNSPVETIIIKACIFCNKDIKLGKRVKLVFFVDNVGEISQISADGIVLSDKEEVLAEAEKKGMKTGLYVRVTDRETLDAAWQRGIKYEYLVIEFKDDTNIPLELVIAQMENNRSNTAIYKVVKTVEDALVASQVLEKGSDGVVLSSEDMDELFGIDRLVSGSRKVQLSEVVVTGVEYIGMGDRGCIDTTSLLGKDEGMIVGSTSSGGILVCSETHYLPYMELRPFRVNAGAVHSYVLAEDNTTRYISEVKAGDTVLCVNTRGEARVVSVGRNKMERRPLLMIKGMIGDVEINTILQDDWHVRVMGTDGMPCNITDLKKGDKLLGCLMESGRHVGLSVNETIVEK